MTSEIPPPPPDPIEEPLPPAGLAAPEADVLLVAFYTLGAVLGVVFLCGMARYL